MKRTFTKIFTAVLALCLACATLIGCGVGGWDTSKVTLKTPGAVKSVGGLVAETENYVYFINGKGVSTDDNALGVPVKGALYAADKSDLSKTSVVVPKLLVASDYNAGVYIYGDYIYYGTPSTDKTSTGSIANSEMMFMRTKVDGTGSEVLFTINSLTAEYRIVNSGEEVYIVYYDSADKALVSYKVSSKTFETIAKTDVTVKAEALNAYKFLDNGQGVTVLYTVTVYTEDYNKVEEENAVKDGGTYSRATAEYNRVYAYKVGDTGNEDLKGVKVLDGAGAIPKTYEINYLSGGYVFYKVTDPTAKPESTMFGVSVTDLLASGSTNAKCIINTTYVADSSIIVDLENVYVYGDGYLSKSTLIGDKNVQEQYLFHNTTVTKLLLVHGDYAYFQNSSNALARVNINPTCTNRVEERVSEGEFVTDWYDVEIVDNKIFYADASATGETYIKCIPTNAQVVAEDTDDDGKNDLHYLKGHIALGEKNEADAVARTEALITEITNGLDSNKKMVFDAKDASDNQTMQKYLDAKTAYDNLTDAQKDKLTKEGVALLEKYGVALEVSRLVAPLEAFKDASDKESFRTAFETAQAKLEAIRSEGKFVYNEVTDLVVGNGMWGYLQAKAHFVPSNS